MCSLFTKLIGAFRKSAAAAKKAKEQKTGSHVSGQNVKMWQWSVLAEDDESEEEIMSLTFSKLPDH